MTSLARLCHCGAVLVTLLSSVMYLASVCLIAGSVVAVSLVLPAVFNFLRAWIILLRIPSPPIAGYIFGHAKFLATTSR